MKTILTMADFMKQPGKRLDGQSCREVIAPTLVEFMGGTACIWEAFPFVAWLNFPWDLEAESTFGMPGKLRRTDTLISVERQRAIDPKVFELPSDFALIRLN